MKLIDLVSMGQIEAVKQAIKRDLFDDINEQDEDGDSPLIMAAMRNDLAIMKELIAAGAIVTIENNYGYSPRDHAEKNKNKEMIELIDETAANESRFSRGI